MNETYTHRDRGLPGGTKFMKLNPVEYKTHVLGCTPNTSWCAPSVSWCTPNVSGYTPSVSWCAPNASGYTPSVSWYTPNASGCTPFDVLYIKKELVCNPVECAYNNIINNPKAIYCEKSKRLYPTFGERI
jgi:hypothetical protein